MQSKLWFFVLQNSRFCFIPLKCVGIFILADDYIGCTEMEMFLLRQRLKYQWRACVFSFCLFVFYPCCFEFAWCMHHSRFRLSMSQVYHRTLGLFTILPFSYTTFAPSSSATLNSGPSWQREWVFYSTSAYSLIKIHKTENSYRVSPFFQDSLHNLFNFIHIFPSY